MSFSELHGFVSHVRRVEALQLKLRQCVDPWEIIELAHAEGYFLSFNDLRFDSEELEGACEHWPWSGFDSQARRRFFLDDAQPA